MRAGIILADHHASHHFVHSSTTERRGFPVTQNATERAHSPQEYRPLAPYVMLTARYSAIVAAGLTIAVRSGRTRPEAVAA